MDRHRRRTLRVAAAATAVALLAGCGSAAAAVVHRGDVLPVRAGALTARDVADAQRAFGVDLLHAACARHPDGNLLLSPTSAAEALGLLYPAATGTTAEQLGRLLHLPPWSAELTAALRDHTRALSGLEYDGDPDDDKAPDSLQLSNHLWTATGLHPQQRYLDDIATAFGADLRSLDFAGDPGGATDRINQTVDDDTHGMIEKLFDQPLARDTAVVLTDALHLKAKWATLFEHTGRAPFAAPSGKVTVDMMDVGAGDRRAADGWQSVELPYRDGTMSAVAVLPPAGSDPCTIDAATLTDLDAVPATGVDVRLPRLTIEQTHDLLGLLTGLGLPVAGAWSALGRDDLQITQVVQKTSLRVDEQGTEAAAATGVGMAASARAPRATVTFDRPFLLLLTDTKTRSPLFAAVVHDPAG